MQPAEETSPSFDFIEVSKIRPNKKNPRGPNVREDDPHRENLRESIAEFKILVPLIVRPLNGEYELIDGERRYWIARSLKLEKVPAYVIKGAFTEKDVLRRMFQIHMNRDQWDAVQQCKASEALYAELLQEYRDKPEELITQFAKFTGDDRRTARNRVQFLRWPSKIKQELYTDTEKHGSYWYIVEIEDKIIEPAQKNYPEYFEKVHVDEVRELLFRKLEASVVKAAVDVRQASVIVRSEVKERRGRKKALRIFNRLVKEKDLAYEEALNEFARAFPSLVESKLPKPRALLNSVHRLTYVLLEYEPEFLEVYEKKKTALKAEILNAVRNLVTAAGGLLKRMEG